MKKNIKSVVSLCVAAQIFATPSLAQDVMKDIVVTATKMPKKINNAPASVDVITQDDFKKKNIKTVDEALRYISGAYVKRGKGLMDTLTSVCLRGIPGQERTLVLIDGMPVNNPSYGGVDWSSISLDDIERIEVVKGPFSSLYGSNAMGGVINIITKNPKKEEISLKLLRGSYDTWISGFSYGNKFKNGISLFLSFEKKRTDGYKSEFYVIPQYKGKPGTGTPVTGYTKTKTPTGKDAYIVGDKGKNWIKSHDFNIKIGYDNEKTKAFVSFREGGHHYGYDNGHSYLVDSSGNTIYSGTVNIEGKNYKIYPYKFLDGEGKTTDDLIAFNIKTSYENLVFHLKTGLDNVRDDWYTMPEYGASFKGGKGKYTSHPSEKRYFNELQFNYFHNIGQLDAALTFGINSNFEKAGSEEWSLSNWKDRNSKDDLLYKGNGKSRTYATYLQEEVDFPKEITTYLGLRYDTWKTYDGYYKDYENNKNETFDERKNHYLSPKLTVVWQPNEDFSLRGAVGKSFRAPTIYELYRTWYWYNYQFSSNPNLKPETTTSWEIGGSAKAKAIKTKLNWTYFDNKIKDLIYSAYLGNINDFYVKE
ncbi:MAG: TonB-dependent receptor [Nitrospiraceae bacterium]|nr:TonB-dependent receptor [Nitrospiraceae bacterium]